jgi:hypothetical protein
MNRLLIFSILYIYPLVAIAQPTNMADYDKGLDKVRAEIKAIPKEELVGRLRVVLQIYLTDLDII